MKALKYFLTALLILLLFGNFKATKIMSFSYETNNQYSCKPFIKANYNEIISVDDYIQISFNLVNGTDDYNVLYDTNNINIIRLYENGDGINTLLAEPYDESSYIDITYTNILISDEKFKTRIYIYSDGEYYYLSDVSFEQCVVNSKRHNSSHLEKYIIYGINTCDTIEYQNNRTNNITVTGIVQWTDSATILHVGKDIRVEVWDMNGTTENLLLASGYTNDEGRYSFTFLNDSSSPEYGYDIRVKFYSNNSYVNVVSPSGGSIYCIVHPTITTNVANDTIVTKSMTIDNNSSDERAFQVLQAMTMAAKYAEKMNSNTALDDINVIFPDSSGSFYSSSNESIHILAADYCDWDVMQHEYGHYTRDSLTTTAVIGDLHSLGVNLIDDYLEDNDAYSALKSEKINLAWSEGWATYFAIACQLDCNASTLNIPNVGNEKYEDTIDGSIIYNLETGNREYVGSNVFLPKGEANEAAIMSILYDFLDGTGEPFDYIQYTHQQIWSKTMNNSVTNLSEFINQYSSESNNQKIKIGRILSKYGAASNTLTNPSVVNTEVPTFTWTAGGGSTNMPNNRFKIVFYSPSYVQLLEKSNLTTNSCTLTESEWTTILSYNYSYVYWVIFAEQTNTPITGAYISEPCTINMPIALNLTYSTPVSNLLTSGGYFWYKFTAPQTDAYTFETGGTTDTYGELFSSMVAGHSTTGRLSYDDDSGASHNFKIIYNLTSGQVVYLRVRGYNWSATGEFSLEVTPSTHIHSYSYTWLNYTQHRATCSCGNTYDEYHVVSAANPGQQYSTCLICGGLASMGIVPHSNNLLPYTVNGSYILPNGVIVLADDDIDAYFAGTLVFIYPNDDLLNNYRTYPFLVRKKEQFVFDFNE